MKLAELAARLQGQLIGDGGLDIVRVADLRTAGPGDISFLTSAEYKPALATTLASAVLLKAADADACPVAAIVVASPYLAYAKVAQWLDPTPQPAVGIAAGASVDPSAIVPASASVAPGAVIGPGCVLADDVVIGANAVLAENVKVGAGSRIYPNVTVYHGVSIGAGCRIHSGTVIGSDGFGYAQEQRQWVRIPQVGSVRIGDQVDIGANCTIDRGALGDTVIGNGVKIDNLVHIAHNVQIGDHSAMAGCSAVAGSAVIGKHVTLAGRVGVLGHLSICDNAHVTATTLITKSITEPGVYSSGTPFQDNRNWRKNAARFNQLDDLARRLRRLEKASGTGQEENDDD